MRIPEQPKIVLSTSEDDQLRQIRERLAELDALIASLGRTQQAGCAACRLSGICGCINGGPRITC